MWDGLFASALIASTTGAMLTGLSWRYNSRERQILWACLAGHIFSAFAMLWFTIYFFGGGDMLYYFENAHYIYDKISQQPSVYLSQVWLYVMGKPSAFSFLGASGTSTGNMNVITAFGLLLTGRESLLAVGMIFSMLAFWGHLLIYEVFRHYVPPDSRIRIALAIFMLPSVLFWTSGIIKESLAFLGLAICFFAAFQFAQRRMRPLAAMLFLFGAVIISGIKPYVLFALTIALGAWLYQHRASGRQAKKRSIVFQIARLVVSALFVVGGLWVLGQLFPRFALDNVAEEAAQLQKYSSRAAEGAGGSNYQIGDANARTLREQLVFMPMGAFFSLFRPFPFEVRNAALLLNALEMLVLMGLWGIGLRRRGLAGLMRSGKHPLVLFIIVFVLIMATAVGLATTNVGTLSRYRIPMMPFYAAFLALFSAPTRPSSTTS